MPQTRVESELQARAQAYRLLADCYYPPGNGLRHSVEALGATLKSLLPQAAGPAAQMLQSIAEQTAMENLQVEFAKLFVGPFHLLAPPYGSVYLEGENQVMGESTAEVRDLFQEQGLDLEEGFEEMPDHIAVELEFMHFLASKELAAMELGDEDAAAQYERLQTGFLGSHLGRWIGPFADKILQSAETDF